jgi:hypothetical protein
MIDSNLTILIIILNLEGSKLNLIEGYVIFFLKKAQLYTTYKRATLNKETDRSKVNWNRYTC